MFNLSSKSVFFTKLAISFLLILQKKLSDVKLSNSWVVIYLSWSWSTVTLFSISPIFVLYSFLLTKLLTLIILFSVALRAVVVAELAMPGVLLLASFILALRAAVVAKLVILDIWFLISF